MGSFLKLIHEGHLGINKCKLHAKETVYWLGLNYQLEKLVLNCKLCLKCSQPKCKPKPTMSLGQKIPLYPWTKLATDLFHFEGASYLLIVDYTSRFPVVCKLSSMIGQHVSNHCKQVFFKYGWPETFISDNGLCYTANAFTSEMNAYHVKHITSSPHYPQSNRLAEKYLQIVKSLIYKAKEKGKDLFKCLMIYHNTPLSGSLQSLVQILQNRCARSDLSMSNAARQQLGLWPEKLRTVYKNEHLPLHDLHIGQDVIFQDVASKCWSPATITSLCVQTRCYNITTWDSVTYRKTQAHLKPYQPQCKKTEDEHSDSDMQSLKAKCKQFDNNKSKNNHVQYQSRPKRDIKPPIKIDLWCIEWIVY